jgi:two-component system chemotaxis response regulator CheB
MAEVKLVRRQAAARAGPPPRPRPAAAPAPAPRQVDIAAVAASTGGPAALATILGALPGAAPVPILVVQHIASGFQQGLVAWLDSISPLSVRLARAGEPLRAGEVLVGPPDVHLGVTGGGRVALSTDPPIGGHRPSASYLFRSVARAYPGSAIGVVLTGMGDDGVAGLRALKDAGGLVLAQDEATSVVYGMPGQAVATGVVDRVLPVDRIAGALTDAWRRPGP